MINGGPIQSRTSPPFLKFINEKKVLVLLFGNNDDWEIENVVCDDSVGGLLITLKYRHPIIKVDGNEFPI